MNYEKKGQNWKNKNQKLELPSFNTVEQVSIISSPTILDELSGRKLAIVGTFLTFSENLKVRNLILKVFFNFLLVRCI